MMSRFGHLTNRSSRSLRSSKRNLSESSTSISGPELDHTSRKPPSFGSLHSHSLGGGGGRGGSTRSGERDVGGSQKEGFWKRTLHKIKSTTLVSGSTANIVIPSIAALFITAIMLVIFRPFFVMTSPDTQDNKDHPPYMPHQTTKSGGASGETISVGAVFFWSVVSAVATAVVTFATRPKPGDMAKKISLPSSKPRSRHW